jgi:hypothetical protein
MTYIPDGVYVGVLAVAAVQYVRFRERRLLPVVALFASLAAAHAWGISERWQTVWHLVSGVTGLTLVLGWSPRPPSKIS